MIDQNTPTFRLAQQPLRYLVFDDLYLKQAHDLGGVRGVESILDPLLRMFECMIPQGFAAPSPELQSFRLGTLEVGVVFEQQRVVVLCVECWPSNEAGVDRE